MRDRMKSKLSATVKESRAALASLPNSSSGMAYNGTSTCAQVSMITLAHVGFRSNSIQPSRLIRSSRAASTIAKKVEAASDGFASFMKVSGRSSPSSRSLRCGGIQAGQFSVLYLSLPWVKKRGVIVRPSRLLVGLANRLLQDVREL